MKIVSEITVSQAPEVVYEYLSNPLNSPKWDRSIDSVVLPDSGSANVGDKITTIAPSGMRQSFTIEKLVPPRLIGFTLDESQFFRSAELQFLIDSADSGTKITHVITIEFRFIFLFLYPILMLRYQKALSIDLKLLARGLERFVSESEQS